MNARDGVVFILDVSGSMYEPYGDTTRLAAGREVLNQQIRELKDGTAFALVVYGETAECSGPLVPANETTRDDAMRFLKQEFDCGGGTNLPAGLTLAGQLQMGSIVLVTDGDLNMDSSQLLPRALKILGRAGACPALTVLAIGPRPHTEAEHLLHELVQQQRGMYESDQDTDLTASLAAKGSSVAAK